MFNQANQPNQAKQEPCFSINDTDAILAEMITEAAFSESSCTTCEGRMASRALFSDYTLSKEADHE